MADSIVAGVYEKLVDRESAFEAIKGRTNTRMADPATAKEKIDAMGKAANAPVGTAAPTGAAPAESSGGSLLDSLGSLLGGVLFDLAQKVHWSGLNWFLLAVGSLWMMILSKNKIPDLYRNARNTN